MRLVLLYLLLLLIFTPTLAQHKLGIALPNPDYLKFLEDVNKGEKNEAAPAPGVLNFSEYWKQKDFKAPADYPVAFDLRTAGPGGSSLVSAVKHQLSCGACWSFATYGSIEGAWMMAGIAEADLSENNLKNCSGFDLEPCQWGHHFMSTAYLVRGSGPISETEDPYQPENDTCQPVGSPVAYIPESRYLPEDHDAFKNAIMNIGPVYNTFKSVSANYQWINGKLTYCYQGTATTSHAVAIIGWNDTITTACGNGAWLVKDQYGTGWGDNGCYYIAYQDTLVLRYNAIWPVREEHNPELKIYQYDTIGGWPFAGYEDSVAYGLIKFTAAGHQFITHIGTYTVSYGTTLKAGIYSDFDGINPNGLLATLPSQYCDYPGFHRLELPEPLILNDGNVFYIQVRWSSPGEVYPMAAEGVEAGYTLPHIETGKCWSRAKSGDWQAWGMGSGFEYDLCIKAYGYDVIRLDLKAILEGPFNGTSMNDGLTSLVNFPLNQPYNVAPWNYTGAEMVSTLPGNLVDWVLVEIRDADGGPVNATSDKIVARQACFLKTNGSIVALDGISSPVFTLVPKNDLYVVIRHRNHLPVMSSAALQKAGGKFTWDFTDAGNKAFGTNSQKFLAPGKYGLIAGDATANSLIDNNDLLNVWHPESGENGYKQSDFDLNTEVNNLDKNDFWNPNQGKSSQIPD